MATNNNNVAYMKEYLRQAMIFEKYVYIWSQSMNEANGYVRDVIYEYDILEQQRQAGYNAEYEPIDRIAYKRAYKEEKKKKSLLNSVFGIIAFILCFQFIPVFLGMAESGKEMAALAAVMAAVIFTIFIIASVLGKKYNNNQIEAKIAREDNSRKRQVMIAQERGRQAEQKLERVSAKKAKLEKSQEDIFKELNEAKKILSNIYAENVLPAKYRSFNAVATLYEYLETGRCNTIQGHGGIYDTYEYDLRLGVIIRNLVEINSRLADIQENQRRLYNEFRQANQTLSQISTTLKNIEDINVDIARNSAISAAANQQTAAASNYMAWHIWHNS